MIEREAIPTELIEQWKLEGKGCSQADTEVKVGTDQGQERDSETVEIG